MTPPKPFASSRRLRLVLWVAGLVLLAGIGAFLGARFSNTAKVVARKPTGSAVHPQIIQKDIPFPEDAWRIAREFAFTALARKNLARSYEISDSTLRSGYTLKQWKTGTLPNLPYFPTAQLVKYNWKDTNFVHPREAQVNIILIATKSSHQRPLTAQIALKKFGQGPHARWLVDYFTPVGGANPLHY